MRKSLKIDIFAKTEKGWEYVCSTDFHRRCKDAITRYKELTPADTRKLRAFFDHKRNRR